jgi:integrase
MPRRQDSSNTYINTDALIVQGRFWVGAPGHEKLYKRKLATFEEVSFDANGDPPKGETAKAARQRDNFLRLRYAEVFKALQEEDHRKRPDGGRRLQEVWQEFVDVARATRAPGTVESYLLTGNHLMKAWGTRIRLPEIGPSALDKLHIYFAERELALPTRNIHLNGLKAFLRWATEPGRDLLDRGPVIKLLRVPRKQVRVADPQHLAQIVRWLDTHRSAPPKGYSPRMLRNVHRAVMMARFAGLRAGEISSLPLAQLDLTAPSVSIRMQVRWAIKERREKRIPLPPWFAQWLAADFKHNGKRERWYLDDGRGNVCYEESHSLTSLVRRVATDAGAPGFALHQLRKSYATALLQAGVDISVVSGLLGHSSVQVTAQAYAGAVDDRKQAAVARIPAPVWESREESAARAKA